MSCQRDFTITVNAPPPLPTPTAYWKLDEVSGNRVDSITGLVLVQNFTPTGSAPGKFGLSAEFPGNVNNRLQTANNATLAYLANGITVTLWVKVNSIIPATQNLDLPQFTFGFPFFNAGWDTTPQFYCQLNQAGDTIFATQATYPLGTGVWHFVAYWFDPADKKVRFQIDNGAVTVSPALMFAAPGASVNGKMTLDNFTYVSDYQIDEVGIWLGGILTPAQLTSLYNGGAGRTYPF